MHSGSSHHTTPCLSPPILPFPPPLFFIRINCLCRAAIICNQFVAHCALSSEGQNWREIDGLPFTRSSGTQAELSWQASIRVNTKYFFYGTYYFELWIQFHQNKPPLLPWFLTPTYVCCFQIQMYVRPALTIRYSR